MQEPVRYPSEQKLIWQVLEILAALRLLDESNLPAAVAALQFKLRANVHMYYALYGAEGLNNYAYLIQLYEPGCREFSWLQQVMYDAQADAELDRMLLPKGGNNE